MSDELLVRHCAPTLAGIKTANMFNCIYSSLGDLLEEIRHLNRRLSKKGLRILPLRTDGRTALIYVYRPQRLEQDLSSREAVDLLKCHGYGCCNASCCISRLRRRLADSRDFPHEIGLFLGYPPEDVRGFIENGAQNCKCVGHWKVYGDEARARDLFAKYRKCTAVYSRHLKNGKSIDHLAVAAR